MEYCLYVSVKQNMIFFEHSIQPRLPSTSTESWIDLVKAEVGTSKDKLDLVDLNLDIGPVVESFGRFVKYSVREKEQSPGTGSSSVKKNAKGHPMQRLRVFHSMQVFNM